MHVDHLGCDGIHSGEILEAAEHDAVRRRSQQAADDLARVLDDDERRVEAVEARARCGVAEQAERQVVLGLAGAEERAGELEERVGFVDAEGVHGL